MDFDTYMIVQIAYLKGKICASIKIRDTGSRKIITPLALQQVHGWRIYTFYQNASLLLKCVGWEVSLATYFATPSVVRCVLPCVLLISNSVPFCTTCVLITTHDYYY